MTTQSTPEFEIDLMWPSALPQWRTDVPNIKNPPKIKFNKFVKLKFILMPAAI